MLIPQAIAALLLAAADTPTLPEWMSGCWEARAGEQWTEECWSAPRAGTMFGFSRSGSGNTLGGWEAMQIIAGQAVDDGPVIRLAFWAAPQGSGRTVFAWSPTPDNGVTFFNTDNDYPQRIRYWREGDELLAEISLADGSESRSWRYRAKR